MPPVPLQNSTFNLDISGVAGFFGGEEVISAAGTVPVYKGRRWLGWYNAPGSYTVAKQYGRLANSRFWDGLFPGPDMEPVELFEFDGEKGPGFLGVHSGTKLKDTGHVGNLFLKECQAMDGEEVRGRKTRPVSVTVAKLPHLELTKPQPTSSKRPHLSKLVRAAPVGSIPIPPLRRWDSLLGLIPIFTSVGACVACALIHDWWCFAMILLGMLAGGTAYLLIGSGSLTFTCSLPAEGSPHGSGVMETPGDILVLDGDEQSVSVVTRSQFSLDIPGKPQYHTIGIAALFLNIQFILQLLFVPQGKPFGQVMFLTTFGVSWVYNCYLSSLDKEKIQRSIIMRHVLKDGAKLVKYEFGTRTTAVVFILLVLHPPSRRSLLNHLLPNDTSTWIEWKNTIVNDLDILFPYNRWKEWKESVVDKLGDQLPEDADTWKKWKENAIRKLDELPDHGPAAWEEGRKALVDRLLSLPLNNLEAWNEWKETTVDKLDKRDPISNRMWDDWEESTAKNSNQTSSLFKYNGSDKLLKILFQDALSAYDQYQVYKVMDNAASTKTADEKDEDDY